MCYIDKIRPWQSSVANAYWQTNTLKKSYQNSMSWHFCNIFYPFSSFTSSNDLDKFFRSKQLFVYIAAVFLHNNGFYSSKNVNIYPDPFFLSVVSIQTKLSFTLVMMIHNTFVIVSKWLTTVLFVLQFSLNSMVGTLSLWIICPKFGDSENQWKLWKH